MDIQTRRGQNTILPRQPDTQNQTLQARQRLDQFNGCNPSLGGNSTQAFILQLLMQLLAQLKDNPSKPQPTPTPKPNPIPDPNIQPVYGVVIDPDPGIVQPVYGAVIDPKPIDGPTIQPVYGVVIEPDPWNGGGAQPVYGSMIESSQ